MYSHPNKELKEHLNNVKILGMNRYYVSKTIWREDKEIEETLKWILKTHDYGKATPYFQEYIMNVENEKYKKSPYKLLKGHGEFSALWAYYFVKKYVKNEKLAFIAHMVVKRHHGFLQNFEKEKFSILEIIDKELLPIWNKEFNYKYFEIENEKEEFLSFQNELRGHKLTRKIREMKKKLNKDDFLLCNYLFSLLISSDKGEAIFYNKGEKFQRLEEIKDKKVNFDTQLVDKYKKIKFGSSISEIDNMREKVYKEIEENILKLDLSKEKILSINLPTGTGKTLAVYNGALKLRERLGNSNKIIYSLPFTSIIDQNYSVLEELLGNTNKGADILIKHHYLSSKIYNDEGYDISKYLIESWESEIVVTTFVQLLNSIFTNINKQLIKFNTLSNSIIILDEVQSIPYKYWKAVRSVLKNMSEKLNCYIILVTATMPLLFNENEVIELVPNKKEYFDKLNRMKLDVSLLKKDITIDKLKEISYREIRENKGKGFLFVFNTIKSSLIYYEGLKEEFLEKEIIYLSSNVTPKERMERIKQIKTTKDVIVVSTQMVEAGVDIDLDIVYRDFGPLDSINQVAGRCNRNGKGEDLGIVRIFSLIDEKGKRFYSYVYKENILRDKTIKALSEFDEVIEEKRFYDLSRTYFKYINEAKSDDKSDKILEAINELMYEKIELKLIDIGYPVEDLFIQLDDEAKQLWNEYQEILIVEDRYIREEKYNKIKSRLYSYVVSVPKKYYRSDEEKSLYLIEESMFQEYYSKETGFKREAKKEDYFI